jgi:hypothetical protein
VLLCTTFDGYESNSPTFTYDSIRQINRDFHDGAVAVKIWKNVRMETKDSNGKYVLPTDSKPQPVYQGIAQNAETLLAEPDMAWSRSTSRKIRRAELRRDTSMANIEQARCAPKKISMKRGIVSSSTTQSRTSPACT